MSRSFQSPFNGGLSFHTFDALPRRASVSSDQLTEEAAVSASIETAPTQERPYPQLSAPGASPEA